MDFVNYVNSFADGGGRIDRFVTQCSDIVDAVVGGGVQLRYVQQRSFVKGTAAFALVATAASAQLTTNNGQQYLLNQNKKFVPVDKTEAIDYVRNSGGYIIKRKGATFYAVSALLAYLCQCLQSDQNTVQDLSTVLHGEYGISDVALSLPTIVGSKGVVNKIILPLRLQVIK